jgi:putative nucleotidyltransferase with HDIG domain
MAAHGARLRLEALPPDARDLLARLSALVPERAWLVGGAVRDGLLGETTRDLDVVVARGALDLGRALAAGIPGAAFVVLDEDRRVGRVVAAVHTDLADFDAPTLDADLGRRDFTVNALAVPLDELCGHGVAAVIDPTGGLADIMAGRVRPCGPGVVAADPVRALRGVRLALRPGFALHAEAEAQIIAAAPALARVAGERVREELAGILRAPDTGRGVRLMDRLGLAGALFPESSAMRATAQSEPHRFDVWEHSLRAVEAADMILSDVDRLAPAGLTLRPHLASAVGDGLTRHEVLKLAALLHDVAKPETKTVTEGRIRFIGHDVLGAERAREVAQRLRLSSRAADVLARLVAHHLRPMHLGHAIELTRRARHRFFRDLGDEARDLLLLALADAAAVRGEPPFAVWQGPGGAVLRALMAGVDEEERAATAAPLVRGEDVMAAFGVGPGPEVGRLLAEVRQAQALGVVATREEALAYLRRARTRPMPPS